MNSQGIARGRAWYQKARYVVPLALVLCLSGYLVWDFYPPRQILVEPATLAGVPCGRAPGLVVQGHDPDGRLWATRGMWAYRLVDGGSRFVRQYRVPTGPTVYWLWNFTLVRWLTSYPECVELLPFGDGGAVALSAGCIWHREQGDRAFERVLRLRHYGIGTGRGAMPAGLARLGDGTVLFGEYWRNPEKGDVRVYGSRDGGRTWRVVHAFPPGAVRHVHAVQEDPYTGQVWICTGDGNLESIVTAMDPDGEAVAIVGQGAQRWRVVQVAFTHEAVLWGADTPGPDGGIWRWDRATRELARLNAIHGPVYYANRLEDGTLVFSQAVEREGGDIDVQARLWVLFQETGPAVPIVLGQQQAGPLFTRYATPRLPRTGGGKNLYVTLVNIEPYAGDLLILSPSAVRRFRR